MFCARTTLSVFVLLFSVVAVGEPTPKPTPPVQISPEHAFNNAGIVEKFRREGRPIEVDIIVKFDENSKQEMTVEEARLKIAKMAQSSPCLAQLLDSINTGLDTSKVVQDSVKEFMLAFPDTGIPKLRIQFGNLEKGSYVCPRLNMSLAFEVPTLAGKPHLVKGKDVLREVRDPNAPASASRSEVLDADKVNTLLAEQVAMLHIMMEEKTRKEAAIKWAEQAAEEREEKLKNEIRGNRFYQRIK